MFEYLKGCIKELTPTYVVLENNQTGYLIHISLHTFGKLTVDMQAMLFVHQVIREDAHLFFGFFDKKERDIFRLLIGVNGIGSNTARMILSSLTPDETTRAIATDDIRTLQNIKGIGAKTAQRMIVDLKDKVSKIASSSEILSTTYNTARDEALSALIMLGFSKVQSEKVIERIVKEEPGLTVEELIKKALRLL